MDTSNCKRFRNKNWTTDEKELLKRLIAKSLPIIENKSAKSVIKSAKINEWRRITKEFNRRSNNTDVRFRSMTELKMAWRRLKTTSLDDVLTYRQTKDGDQPLSVSEAPFELTVNVNYDDNNDDPTEPDGDCSPYQQEIKLSPSDLNLSEQNGSQSSDTTDLEHSRFSMTTEEITDKSEDNLKKQKKDIMYNNMMNNFIKNTVSSNEEFKRRHMEILEKEHEYNIAIAKLKVKKLELQIALLSKEVNNKNNGTN